MGLLLVEVHYTILQTTQLRSHQALHTEASKSLILKEHDVNFAGYKEVESEVGNRR